MKALKKIGDIAKYIRSKNAGPFWITIDIFCENDEDFNILKESKSLSEANIARLYNVDQKSVKIFPIRNLKTIKVSFPRPKPQGHKFENDMHSGQQYIQIAEAPV